MKKKSDWLYQQLAVVPLIIKDQRVSVVLISQKISPGSGDLPRWMFPKGVIEGPGERESDERESLSALNEAWEEDGIKGKVSPAPVGLYRYNKWGGECSVKVYAMKVKSLSEDWPEKLVRKRELFTISDAKGAISKPDQALILEMLKSQDHLLNILARDNLSH